MTTITDYLNDLRHEMKRLIEDTYSSNDEKLKDVDAVFEEAEDSIKELLERII